MKVRKHKHLVIATIGVVVVLAVGIGIRKKNGKAQLATTSVSAGDISLKILVTGTVQSQNRLEIKPPTSGRVEEIKIQEGASVRKGQILAWMSSSERVSLLDAARAKGAVEVKRWKELYRATPIISPLTGTLILNSVKTGQTVASSDVVFVVSDRLIVQATVDETDIAQVKKNLSAAVVLDAYPKNPLPGHVVRIAYDAKTTNNVTTYQVDIVPDSVPEFMMSGMTANVTFLVSQKENVVSVPVEAIHDENGKSYVLVPGVGPKKEIVQVRRDIELGLSDGKRTEVTSGLTVGESVYLPVWSAPEVAAVASNPFMPAFPKPNSKREKANGEH